jgi:mRNA interferase MazF
MMLRKGMVVMVDLNPTKGSETGKIRPCVIVTNDVYNQRVPVIQVVPITEWNEKKGRIISNVTIEPTAKNGLSKRSVADCLQTRPIDHRQRLVNVKGELEKEQVKEIDDALKIVFGLK